MRSLNFQSVTFLETLAVQCKIEINMDNAAFSGNGGAELSRILKKLAHQVECDAHDGLELSTRDENGNKCGKLTIDKNDENDSDLFLYARNDGKLWKTITFAVDHLRQAFDRAAESLAKERADWHDDPSAEDHAAYHAPADTQFPAEDRNAAALEAFTHYLHERWELGNR